MLVLIDTGIPLRLLEATDPQQGAVRAAVRALRARGDTLVRIDGAARGGRGGA